MSDVAIAGGGATGLSLALALRELSRGDMRVILVDPSEPAARSGLRTSAIAEGPRRMLERLGVWQRLVDAAQPVSAMEISDARLEEAVRTALLTFGARAGEPLAHMVFHRDLEPALLERARASGVEILADNIEAVEAGASSSLVRLGSGGEIRARLVVGADGVNSRLRGAAGVSALTEPYDRLALVLTISHEDEHNGIAVQHFLESGPFACLPLRGLRSSIVWTEPTSRARALLGSSCEVLRDALDERLRGRFGPVSIEEGPQAFPLVFQIARSFVAPRLALVGDAAHRVHPLAGQGLNIGLRDVATLAELVIEQCSLGLDPGAESVLSEYQRRRRFDAMSSATAFDLINRSYGATASPVRAARRFAMSAIDRTPGIKGFLQREASGTLGPSPALFR
jgi:2-octaprenyl-6-methoxyphenol hydroxylase